MILSEYIQVSGRTLRNIQTNLGVYKARQQGYMHIREQVVRECKDMLKDAKVRDLEERIRKTYA